MVSRPSNIRGREIGVSEGQTGTQSGSEEQRNHEVERTEHQRKIKAQELPQ